MNIIGFPRPLLNENNSNVLVLSPIMKSYNIGLNWTIASDLPSVSGPNGDVLVIINVIMHLLKGDSY